MKLSILRRLSRNAGWISSVRQVSSVKVNMDSSVEMRIQTNEMHPKRHPGAQRNVNMELPSDIKEAIAQILPPGHRKMIDGDVVNLSKYLDHRKPPMEADAERELVAKITQEVKDSVNVDWERSSEEAKEYYRKSIASKVERICKERKYDWQPIDFTRHKGLTYLVARSAKEYVVNFQVLKELKTRFDYSPKTLFDFGSGVGCVLWAADTLWSKSLKEVFTVDTSLHMNEIAREILALANKKYLKNLMFQRQFLPVSDSLNFDVVVSSYSLLELPSASDRLATVLNLWNKTNDFLVLIEFGTKAGFQLINEARDFLLWGMKKPFSKSSQYGHVVAPCPHDLPCPRAAADNPMPCNFSATYTSYPDVKLGVNKELFSYIVLRKGPKTESDSNWPRIVRPVLTRHRHAICRLCTSQGKLSEVIFSPAKHGKVMYTCARQSKWGDRLPVSLEDIQSISES